MQRNMNEIMLGIKDSDIEYINQLMIEINKDI